MNRGAESRAIADVRFDNIATMMHVDDDFIEAMLHQSPHVVFENGHAGNGYHWLGPIGGEWVQTRTLTRGENHGFQVRTVLGPSKRSPPWPPSEVRLAKEANEADGSDLNNYRFSTGFVD